MPLQARLLVLPSLAGYVITELQDRDTTLRGEVGSAMYFRTPGLARSRHLQNGSELAALALKYSLLDNSIWSTVRGG